MRLRFRYALVAALVAACHGDRTGDGSLLDRVPGEADLVVMVRPAEVGDSWAGALAIAQARRLAWPPCVVARALASTRVVVARSHTLPRDGWLVAMTGGPDRPCPALVTRGAIAIWSDGLDERGPGEPGFFEDRTRRTRWSALANRPIRGLAEHELSAGIVAHVEVTVDPRDGVDLDGQVRFDSPDAAAGARTRLERWRGNLDRDRMGGAWPAVSALVVEGPGVGDVVLDFRLRVAGTEGSAAAPLLVTALTSGADRSDRAPCPLVTAWSRRAIRCANGELQVLHGVAPLILADMRINTDVRVTTTMSAGAITGLRLTAVGASSTLVALGLREGDWLQRIDGVTVTSAEQLAGWITGLRPDTTLTLGFVRGGRSLVLRYRLVDALR